MGASGDLTQIKHPGLATATGSRKWFPLSDLVGHSPGFARLLGRCKGANPELTCCLYSHATGKTGIPCLGEPISPSFAISSLISFFCLRQGPTV